MKRRTHRLVPLAGVVAVAVLAHQAARCDLWAQTPQTPAFRSGVELVTVDVSVIDKGGSPIRSLRSDQFEVAVDGHPRRVVSAELMDYAPTAGPAPTVRAKDLPRPTYSSNDAPGTQAAPGRLIFIAIDQGSFRPLGARGATEAARRFIDRLQPQDRVGLVAFPPPGPSVAASKNHAAVRDATRQIVGSAESLASSLGRVRVSLAEAIDIGAGDEFAFAKVADRECQGLTGHELTLCRDQVRLEAQNAAVRAEVQAGRTLHGLRSIVGGMAKIQERKTLVLISAGLPTADRFGGGLDLHSEISFIARDAALANANIYVLHVDSAFLDAFSASEGRVSETLIRDSSMMAAGLDDMAGASGGTLFHVAAGADFAFDRVLQETAASYVLGVEPVEGDRNGKPHTIKVSVKAPGAQVRSRREFVLSAQPAAPDRPDSLLATALRAQRVATALHVGVSTHTLGRASSGGLRVLITANVGRGLAGPIEAQVGYVITDVAGRVAANVAEKQRLSVPPSSGVGSASYVSMVGLEPGEYNLRLAVADPSGSVGSVDHSFLTGLGDGEGIAMGDLLLLDPVRSPNEGFSPVADGRVRGRTVDAYLEIYARAGSSPPAGVSFGIADRADGEPLVQTRASASKKETDGRSIAEARLDLSLLPPGDYVALATVSDGKHRLGRQHQPLRIERIVSAAENGVGASGALPRVRFVIGESSSLVRAFTRNDVLTPDTLAFFAGRLEAAEKSPAPAGIPPLVAALRAGQFDTVLATLNNTASDRLSVAFLKGLALLGKGELEPAAGQFRESLRIADDFLPAAFYLGACYAAGGRDSEAVGAWQTALVTESDASIVYDVLADALLRLEDAGQAIEVLTEARGRWPDDAGFLPRLAAAQAMLQHPDEALATLDAYLERHQSDAEATALAIRLIYEAHAAGRTLKSAAADRDLATKYEALYRAASGSNQALVDRWVAFIGRS